MAGGRLSRACVSLAPVKRNRFIESWRPGARSLAGIKGYVTSLAACPDGIPVTADLVISSYHELWKSKNRSECQNTTCRLAPPATASAPDLRDALALIK